MEATRRDLEVAEELAAEIRAHQGQRRTWRYVDTLLDLFDMEALTSRNRRRIQDALVEAGLDPDPPVTDVGRDGSVRFARPAPPREDAEGGRSAESKRGRATQPSAGAGADASPSIFISYRREDCQAQANGLNDGLRNRLPGAEVFFDVDSIPPGVDFEEHIQRSIEAADVVLVLIGDNWLDRDASGRRRIDEPGDFVRLEVAAALEREKTLIPVLVEDARMPPPTDLPEGLAALARRNAIELSGRRWRSDVDRLARAIRSRPGGPRPEPTPHRDRATDAEGGDDLDMPTRVTQGWIERTVPQLGRTQFEQLVAELRRRGWTDGELVDRVYMHARPDLRPSPTRSGDPRRAGRFTVPSRVTERWLAENVSVLDGHQRERLAEVLRQRGWTEGEIEDGVHGRVRAAR
jgi:hypothetical protein